MNVKITTLTQEHILATYNWLQDEELRALFLMEGEVSWEGHLNYFSKVFKDITRIVYAIYVDDKHVGNCGYKDINHQYGEGELWLYIGESAIRGQGVGKKVMELLMSTGIKQLKFNKIYLYVSKNNLRAINLYQYFGFSTTNRLIKQFGGNRIDTILRMEKDLKK